MSTRGKLQPWLLMLVYVGPLIVAAAVYFSGWRPSGEAHGELLTTPESLPIVAVTTPSGDSTSEDWLQRYWSLIYAPQAQCTQACIERLNRLNQVRLALGKDMGRAQVVLLYTGTTPNLPDGADVVLARADDAAGSVVADFLKENTSAESRIYLSDPYGRLVLAYAADVDQYALLEDLERLLEIL